MQGLVGGIPYDELGSTTLKKTQLSYLAELHRMELAARVHVDLEMTRFSGTAVAKLERERSDKDEDDNPLDVERGRELTAEKRLALEFKTWAPHRQAAYVRRHGWPWETEQTRVLPYEGMDPEAAAEMDALIGSGKLDTFTDFWEQAGDPLIQERLKVTAKGKAS